MLNESRKPSVTRDITRLENIKSNLKIRSIFLQELRHFFIVNDFLEIETPIMIQSPAPEDHINAPQAGDFFLRTSPELHMKRLVAAGYDKIFQIGSCFREGEIGRLHNAEFSMLEWYEAGKDYSDLLLFLKDLLVSTVKKVLGSTAVNFAGNIVEFDTEWKIYTVREAFKEFAGTTPEKAIEDGMFEILLTEKIEPKLPKDRPVVLKDYPAAMAALSRLKEDDNTLAERWELYLGGIEIANAYSELTDPLEQEKRFEAVNKRREELNLPSYSVDSDFFAALKYGIDDYAGIALGIDRLIMILTDSNNISDVLSFVETKDN